MILYIKDYKACTYYPALYERVNLEVSTDHDRLTETVNLFIIHVRHMISAVELHHENHLILMHTAGP
jgi:hypothetical protein